MLYRCNNLSRLSPRRRASLAALVLGVSSLALAGAKNALADSALAWGDNTYGQLGNGHEKSRQLNPFSRISA
jgi:alpha-tubulin suppressor-like RCC1 family protein